MKFLKSNKKLVLIIGVLLLFVPVGLTGCAQIGDFFSGFLGNVNSENLARADRIAQEVKDMELTVLTQIEPMEIEYHKIVSAAKTAEAEREFQSAMKLWAAASSLKDKVADLYERLRTVTDPLVKSVNEIRDEHNRRTGSAWYRLGGTAATVGLLAFGIYKERKGRKAAETGKTAETSLLETVLHSVDLLDLDSTMKRTLSNGQGRSAPEIDVRLNELREAEAA